VGHVRINLNTARDAGGSENCVVYWRLGFRGMNVFVAPKLGQEGRMRVLSATSVSRGSYSKGGFWIFCFAVYCVSHRFVKVRNLCTEKVAWEKRCYGVSLRHFAPSHVNS
jgi:hypothetical protein